jgi:hypothetical protein
MSRVVASAKTGPIAGYRANGTAAWCDPDDSGGDAGVDAVILQAAAEPAAATDDAVLAEKNMAVSTGVWGGLSQHLDVDPQRSPACVQRSPQSKLL